MKSRLCTLGLTALLGTGTTATAQPTVLVDFGNDSSYRGASVPAGPDANGNHWNSVWSGAYYADMVDTGGNATTIDLGFSDAPGTDSYNGPAGPTDVVQDPSLSDYDAGALGNLGVDEAVFDYYVSSTFEIQGLDASKTYDLTFYGSFKFGNDAVTRYAVYSDNTYSTLVASADLEIFDAASPWLHNRDTTATISGVSPQEFDILYVKFFGAGGGSGILNAMSITEVPTPASALLLGLGGLVSARRRR
ncbi:MAG: hypothetical protein ACF8Q5_06695 [Phycisphaerales bacterium JB040]